jgi:hypothetical protein
MGKNTDVPLLHISGSLGNYYMERGADDRAVQTTNMKPQKDPDNLLKSIPWASNRSRRNVILIEQPLTDDEPGPSSAPFGQRWIKDNALKHQVFVESASEDSAQDSNNSNKSGWKALYDSDSGEYLGANERREKVGKEAEKVTETEWKIQAAQETATIYRQKAEYRSRAKRREVKQVLWRGQSRQDQISEEQKEAE